MIRSDFPQMKASYLQQTTSHQARSPSMEQVLATTQHNYKQYPYVVSTVGNSFPTPMQYPQQIQQEFQQFQGISPQYAPARQIQNYSIQAPKTKDDYVLFPRNSTAQFRQEPSQNLQNNNNNNSRQIPQQEYYQVGTNQPRYYSVNPPIQPSQSYSNTVQNNRTTTEQSYQSPWQVQSSVISAKSPRRKIFSPVSEDTIESIQSEIQQRHPQIVDSNSRRMSTSISSNGFGYPPAKNTIQTNQQPSKPFEMYSSIRNPMESTFIKSQAPVQSSMHQSLKPTVMQSNLQKNSNIMSSPERKLIFSAPIDYAKDNNSAVNQLTKNKIWNQIGNGETVRKRLSYQDNQQQEDMFEFNRKRAQIGDAKQKSNQQMAYSYQQDDQNESVLSSYQSFKHDSQLENAPNDSTDEWIRGSSSLEKSSALQYLQEGRVKKSINDQTKKPTQEEIEKRGKTFYYAMGALVLLIIVFKIIQMVFHNLS